jgi:hypothetical protein
MSPLDRDALLAYRPRHGRMSSMGERLRLMADYQSWPLWRDGGDNVDPASLPISPGLQERLIGWAARFDATLDHSDPLSSGFPDDAAERRFEADGVDLWKDLRAELGDGYSVAFFSPTERRLIEADAGARGPGG